ncbi:unnamed protein product [Lupinus luteus]|uniref:Fucosyltransferase n=1 Tax=Lupinus luteus TaxID=3873 RepID=A0AAV1WGX6_LUPLU
MDMIQGTLDKIGLNSKKKLTAFFIVIFIAIPVTFTVTKKLSNSSFTIFEGSSQNMVSEGETPHNNGNGKSNVTNNGSGFKGSVQNGTDKEITAPKEGDKNNSITNSPNVLTPHTANPDDKDKSAPSTSPSNVSTPDIANSVGKDKNGSLTSPAKDSNSHNANRDEKEKNASVTSPSNVSTPHITNPNDKDKNVPLTSPSNVSTPHGTSSDDKDKNASSKSPSNVSTPHTANPDGKDKNVSSTSSPNVSTPHIANPNDKDKNASSKCPSNVSTPHAANPDDKDKNASSTNPPNVSTPHTANPNGQDKNASSTSPPNVPTPPTANPNDKDKNTSSTSLPNVSTPHAANPNGKDKNTSSTSPSNVSTPHTSNPDNKDKNASSTSPPNVSIRHTANPGDKDKNVSSTSPPNVPTPHPANPDGKDKNVSSTSPPNVGNPNDSRSKNHDDKDKLIDGLLASGFDEASCTSRFQSHLFRKASPHKPSQYLISKLRQYEELHRKCGPNSRDFKRNMKFLHSKKKGAAGNCKYLVWTPANGLGNRMISLTAAFLYAIFADRVLLVRFRDDMQGLFCEPFLNSTWVLPKHSPFWSDNHVETYKTMLKMDKASHSKRPVPSTLFLNLQHTHDDPEKFFHCDHNQDLLRNITLLIVQSDQYFVPYLFMNPSFNSEINKMFPEKDAIFHHLARYLFHPSNEAWGLISRFYKTYLASADERIGLQIRVFSPTTTPMQAVMDLVLNCTLTNKLLPHLDAEKSVSYSPNQTVKAVLVASLYPEYGENLRAMYLHKPSVSGELIGVYQPSHEEEQKFHDNMHNIKAWTEMYLLSLSDVLVTTSLSTFGYVAQGLGGLKPWLLYRLTSNAHYFPACVRDFSIEPCNHIPPKHFCNGEPIKNFASSFPHLRTCLDYYAGVKLANNSSK